MEHFSFQFPSYFQFSHGLSRSSSFRRDGNYVSSTCTFPLLPRRYSNPFIHSFILIDSFTHINTFFYFDLEVRIDNTASSSPTFFVGILYIRVRHDVINPSGDSGICKLCIVDGISCVMSMRITTTTVSDF